METVIKTVNLTKRYGSLVALSNLNLEIQEGDCFGYIGPNGAGKSTTIKILATLLQPTWGEARVCGYVVGYQSRMIRPLLGYVPDYFGAYEDMVVQEYLEFFAAAYNINGSQRTKVVNDVLELTDLGYKRDAQVGPVVVLGIGGVLAEIYKDFAVRLAPVSVDQARTMIDEVKGLAVIRGYRGMPKGDLDALAKAVAALSQIAHIEDVQEAEINPLIVKREGEGVIAVDGLIVRE